MGNWRGSCPTCGVYLCPGCRGCNCFGCDAYCPYRGDETTANCDNRQTEA